MATSWIILVLRLRPVGWGIAHPARHHECTIRTKKGRTANEASARSRVDHLARVSVRKPARVIGGLGRHPHGDRGGVEDQAPFAHLALGLWDHHRSQTHLPTERTVPGDSVPGGTRL